MRDREKMLDALHRLYDRLADAVRHNNRERVRELQEMISMVREALRDYDECVERVCGKS